MKNTSTTKYASTRTWQNRFPHVFQSLLLSWTNADLLALLESTNNAQVANKRKQIHTDHNCSIFVVINVNPKIIIRILFVLILFSWITHSPTRILNQPTMPRTISKRIHVLLEHNIVFTLNCKISKNSEN